MIHKTKFSILSFLSVLLLLAVSPVFAAVMSSTNYQIDRDSINAGGFDNSTSTNYSMIDTVGEVGSGLSTSGNYQVNGGYIQQDSVYISVTVPGSVVMSPSIGGISGGVSNGNGTWNVRTDSQSGYTLYIKATNTPAMTSGANSIGDYSPQSAGVPDYDWSIIGSNSEFGFSPYNMNSQISKYKNSGASCNTGSSITDGKCWYGLSTNDEAVAVRNSSTAVGGEDTKVNFRAEVNSVNGFQTAGTYIATIIVTAVSN